MSQDQELSVELEALEPSDSLDDILDPDTQPPHPGGIVGCLTVHKMKFAYLFMGAFAQLANVTGRPHILEASDGTNGRRTFDATFGIKCEGEHPRDSPSGGGGGGGFTQDVRSRRLSQTEARARAWELTRRMTLAEKMRMVVGVGWRQYAVQPGFYVGNIPAIPHLGVPSINMQDGPQGFRAQAQFGGTLRGGSLRVGTRLVCEFEDIGLVPGVVMARGHEERAIDFAHQRGIGLMVTCSAAMTALGYYPIFEMARDSISIQREGPGLNRLIGEIPKALQPRRTAA